MRKVIYMDKQFFGMKKEIFTKSQIYENGELLETSTTPPENLSEVANSLTTGLQDHEAPTPTEETFDLENNNDAASLNAQLKESFHENGSKKNGGSLC